MVPADSAAIPMLDAPVIAMNRNHITLVKFSSKSDKEYVSVARHISQMVTDALRNFVEHGDCQYEPLITVPSLQQR
jgi:hypothetical protein